jgi:hypothetical protein
VLDPLGAKPVCLAPERQLDLGLRVLPRLEPERLISLEIPG